MQFQKVGGKIRVIEYKGYDRIKRRSIVRMIASVDAYQEQLQESQKVGLTDEQIVEIDAYLRAEVARRNDEINEYKARSLDKDIDAAVQYYQSHPTDLIEHIASIEGAIKKLKAVARKAKKTAAATANNP